MSAMVGPPSHPRALRRTVLAVFALALLLPGLVERHGRHDAADLLAKSGVRLEAYFPAAAHPGLPLHLEGAAEGEVRHCAACLQSLHSRAAEPDRASFSVPPAPRRLLPAARPVVLARRWSAAAAGRAPPLS